MKSTSLEFQVDGLVKSRKICHCERADFAKVAATAESEAISNTMEKLLELAQICESTVVPANTVVFEQGDPGDSFYLINAGKVRVFRKCRDGVETELARLGPGESFGEMALVTGEPRSGHEEALEETHLTVISKDEFDRILKDYPRVSHHLVQQLSSWLLRGDLRLERETERRFG